jgi:hypothetical protein
MRWTFQVFREKEVIDGVTCSCEYKSATMWDREELNTGGLIRPVFAFHWRGKRQASPEASVWSIQNKAAASANLQTSKCVSVREEGFVWKKGIEATVHHRHNAASSLTIWPGTMRERQKQMICALQFIVRCLLMLRDVERVWMYVSLVVDDSEAVLTPEKNPGKKEHTIFKWQFTVVNDHGTGMLHNCRESSHCGLNW